MALLLRVKSRQTLKWSKFNHQETHQPRNEGNFYRKLSTLMGVKLQG